MCLSVWVSFFFRFVLVGDIPNKSYVRCPVNVSLLQRINQRLPYAEHGDFCLAPPLVCVCARKQFPSKSNFKSCMRYWEHASTLAVTFINIAPPFHQRAGHRFSAPAARMYKCIQPMNIYINCKFFPNMLLVRASRSNERTTNQPPDERGLARARLGLVRPSVRSSRRSAPEPERALCQPAVFCVRACVRSFVRADSVAAWSGKPTARSRTSAKLTTPPRDARCADEIYLDNYNNSVPFEIVYIFV